MKCIFCKESNCVFYDICNCGLAVCEDCDDLLFVEGLKVFQFHKTEVKCINCIVFQSKAKNDINKEIKKIFTGI